jgi:hypothetical protein
VRLTIEGAAQHGVPADRFAREIVRFWRDCCGALATAEHQAVGRLGSVIGTPVLVPLRRSRMYTPVVQRARCAGVVRAPVVRIARCGQRDHMLGVIPPNARYASVIACRRGAIMPAAGKCR